ncbi:MAG: GIY-YIG nuclease family protein [Planctomycetota bacterium]
MSDREYTYFMVAGSFCKIGVSDNPEARLKTIQTGCPETVVLINKIKGNVERDMHEMFAKYRTNGEWFKIQGDLRSYLIKHGYSGSDKFGVATSNAKPYTVIEAAEVLGIPARAVRDLIGRCEIRAYDVSSRPGTGKSRYRITPQAISDFIEARTLKAPPTKASVRRKRRTRRAVPQYV